VPIAASIFLHILNVFLLLLKLLFGDPFNETPVCLNRAVTDELSSR